MTQVLHTPLGQPIFVGNSAQTASLLQSGVPLHLLPSAPQVQVAGLQARPRSAPVVGKKLGVQAAVQSKDTWAKPRVVEAPSKPTPKVKENAAATLKPESKPKPKPKPKVKAPPKPVEVAISVELPLAASPVQLLLEEPVKTQPISEILLEAKRKAKEAKERELFEAERQRQEDQAKQARLSRLLAVAEARRTESHKAETRHPMPWGANQRKQVEEQQRIKDCAAMRQQERARKVPLPEDRVGLADVLEVKRNIDQPAVQKKQLTPPPPMRPSVKEIDPEVQLYMQEKQVRDKQQAYDEEHQRQKEELERLLRLRDLETLHRAKLQAYKAHHPTVKPSKPRRRVKQILARARAKLRADPVPRAQLQEQEEVELSLSAAEIPDIPESEQSEEPLKPTNLSTPQEDTDSTEGQKREVQVVTAVPAVFVSEAARRAEEESMVFQALERTRELDIHERKAEVKRKLAELQKRISDHLQPPAPEPEVTSLKKFPEQPLVMDQQYPGVSNFAKALQPPPAPITVHTDIPGNSSLPPVLTKEKAAIRIQTGVRSFLARRRVARLRVKRSIAMEPELQRQLEEYDKGALAVLEKAYTVPPDTKITPSNPISHSHIRPNGVAESRAMPVKLTTRPSDDNYSLFKVILRTNAFQPVLPESYMRQDTPDYSESFETPSKSSQELSIQPVIKEQLFEDSQSSKRSIPEEVHATTSEELSSRRYTGKSQESISEDIDRLSVGDLTKSISERLDTPKSRSSARIDSSRKPIDSISERISERSKTPTESISEHLSVTELSKSYRKPDKKTAELPTARNITSESISEHLSVADLSKSYGKPDSGRKPAEIQSGRNVSSDSISEHLSVAELSKSHGKPDSGRKPAEIQSGRSISSESISEHLSVADLSKSYGKPDSGRKPADLKSGRNISSDSISEHLSVADLSKSYGKQDSEKKPSDSISEHLSVADQSKSNLHSDSQIESSQSISEHLSVTDLSKSYGKPDSARKPFESISEESKSKAQSSESISEELDVSKTSGLSDSREKRDEKPGRKVESPVEELSRSLLDSGRKPHSSVEESIIEESISEVSEQEHSETKPKYDSPGVQPEETVDESIHEELSHAHVSTESMVKSSIREKSDNIKTLEDYSEDFESESLAVSGRPREDVHEPSDTYSSDFENASHQRFDSVSQDHPAKDSIEEEDIEEELSQGDNYEDDFESVSGSHEGSHEDETLRTSTSLPRSTIGGDVEASQASDSVEWEIEVSHTTPVIPEELSEEIQTESDENESVTEKQADLQTDDVLKQLITEAIQLAMTPVKPLVETKKIDALLPSLPPLPQKAAITLLPTAQHVTQDLTTLVSELLDQALRSKAVLNAMSRPAPTNDGLVDQLQSQSKTSTVLDDRFWSNWSMQAELLESGSLTEDFQGKKPLMKVAFDVVNEELGRLRPHSHLPWEPSSKALSPNQLRAKVEEEIASMLRFQAGPLTAENVVTLQKLRDERTAKLLDQELHREVWGAYERQEAAVKIQVADSIFDQLARETADLLRRCS